MHLKLSTDRKFALSDENYLFDCMGLTKTTSEELGHMFEPKVIDFLRRSELVQALPKSKPAVSGRSEGIITEDLHCEAMTPNSMLQ